MAGDSYLFDKAGLAKITIPMMAMGGTADTSTPYEWGVKPAYDYASSAQKALVTINGAEHPIFISLCKNLPWTTKLDSGTYTWLCFDPVWDKSRALDVINHLSTAFLLDVLKGDKDAHKALLPDAVRFAGIEYKTTMK
jgi:predicted dienelactone hydrolase